MEIVNNWILNRLYIIAFVFYARNLPKITTHKGMWNKKRNCILPCLNYHLGQWQIMYVHTHPRKSELI